MDIACYLANAAWIRAAYASALPMWLVVVGAWTVAVFIGNATRLRANQRTWDKGPIAKQDLWKTMS
jgi:hypothetical protein